MKDGINLEEYINPSGLPDNPLVVNESKFNVKQTETKTNKSSFVYYYLSDLHLDFKIENELGISSNIEDIKTLLCSIIDMIFKSTFNENSAYDVNNYGNSYILLGGDISYNPEIVTMFLDLFRARFHKQKLIYILGNHEYWNYTENGLNFEGYSAEDIIEFFRNYCYKNNIIFLEKDIFITKSGKDSILSENAINSMTDEELHNLLSYSDQIILGGTGFAGNNDNFNASKKIYGNTIKSIEEELILSKRFVSIYHRLFRIMEHDDKIIIFTHMPYYDWIDYNPNPNWTYVFGHTHKNIFIYDDSKKIIADNQWGYHQSPYEMKYFFNSFRYDCFSDRPNGIYRISHQVYEFFNKQMGISISFNKNGQIFLLKNEGFYFFMFENSEKKLYYLSGGRVRKCNFQKIEYYYENMPFVGNKITSALDKYMEFLLKVSSVIKKIGGDGRIHGCIIDIDFTNHLFVNPHDLKITPYYAPYDMVTKYVYSNLISLLKAQCSPILFDNYIKLLKNGDSNTLAVVNSNDRIDGRNLLYRSTDIYKDSFKMKSLQYTWENRIIRNWVDPELPKIYLNDVDSSAYPEIKGPLQNAKLLKSANTFTLKSSYSQIMLKKFLEDRIPTFSEKQFDIKKILNDFYNRLRYELNYDVSNYSSLQEQISDKIKEYNSSLDKFRKDEADLLFKTICCEYVSNLIKNSLNNMTSGKIFRNKSKLNSIIHIVPHPISVCCDPSLFDISHFRDSGLFFCTREAIDSINSLISDMCESLISIGETNRLIQNKRETDETVIDEDKFFNEICKKTPWQQRMSLFKLSRQELMKTAKSFLSTINEICKRKYLMGEMKEMTDEDDNNQKSFVEKWLCKFFENHNLIASSINTAEHKLWRIFSTQFSNEEKTEFIQLFDSIIQEMSIQSGIDHIEKLSAMLDNIWNEYQANGFKITFNLCGGCNISKNEQCCNADNPYIVDKIKLKYTVCLNIMKTKNREHYDFMSKFINAVINYGEECRFNMNIELNDECLLKENDLFKAIIKEMTCKSPRYALIANHTKLIGIAREICSVMTESFGKKFIIES